VSDESFFEIAQSEFDSGQADSALKAKAYVMASGDESRVKLEYMKLRVAQLKVGNGSSLADWYSSTSSNERVLYFLVSCVLILFYGIGLIPLFVLIYLEAGERDRISRLAKEKTDANG
jgi:hypothetical protein